MILWIHLLLVFESELLTQLYGLHISPYGKYDLISRNIYKIGLREIDKSRSDIVRHTSHDS